MTIEYHPALELELRTIRDYYDGKVAGLGNEFIDEFERLALRIASAPGRWRVVQGDIRRALMSRFPYVIYFRWLQDDVIRITVVKHERRHPEIGRGRL